MVNQLQVLRMPIQCTFFGVKLYYMFIIMITLLAIRNGSIMHVHVHVPLMCHNYNVDNNMQCSCIHKPDRTASQCTTSSTIHALQANRTLYAVYHSVHDNFYWMSEFGDPSFTHHLATGLVWIKLALILSTEPVLPFDPRDYAIVIGEIFQNLKDSSGDILEAQGISLCEKFYVHVYLLTPLLLLFLWHSGSW